MIGGGPFAAIAAGDGVPGAFDGTHGATAERARWLVRMHWSAAVFGLLALGAEALLTRGTLKAGSYVALVATIAALCAVNALLHLRTRSGRVGSSHVFAALAFDVLAVTIALHVTGGVENPFQVYYLLPIIVAGIALPRFQAYGLATLAAVLFAGVGTLEYAKILPHHDVALLPAWRTGGGQHVDQYEDLQYLTGECAVLLSTLFGATYLSTSVAAILRRREHDLWLAKERLEGILRGLGEGVAYFDARGALVLANPSFARTFPAVLDGIGRCVREVAPTELHGPLALAEEALRRGSSYESFEAQAGSLVVACGLSPVRGAGGFAWVVDDVTERRASERRVQSERRLADMGVLAAGIAHEVLNPLASISSTAQLIEDEAGSNRELMEALGRIRTHVARITGIVRGVAELARSGRELGSAPPVPLDEIVVDAVARAREERPRSGEVRIHVDHPAPCADVAEEPLRIALKNLVTNAIDATGPEGHVDVRVRRGESEIVVEVEDDGPGFATDDVEKIFLPFYTTKSPGRGAGLGLAIAASIVRQHRGKIDVASSPGKGARFSVRLPEGTTERSP